MKKKILTTAVLAIVICALAFALTACNSAKSIENRLLDADYEVYAEYIGGESVDLDDTTTLEGVTWELAGYKVSTYDYVHVIAFDKTSQAKDAYAVLKKYYEEFEEYTVKKEGKIVAFGTPAAVKAAL